MKCLSIGLVLVLVVLGGPARAESRLIDQADEFTDERELFVGITSDKYSAFNRAALIFSCRKGDIDFAITPGTHFHFGDSIDVKLRFDSKPMKSEKFRWGVDTALKTGAKVSEWLLDALVSNRLIVKVGDSSTLRFDLEDARGHLEEFRRRCGQWAESK